MLAQNINHVEEQRRGVERLKSLLDAVVSSCVVFRECASGEERRV